ncbi:MAG: signal peptidase II [bacterium]|nr:signal peptidase II [bacterium]
MSILERTATWIVFAVAAFGCLGCDQISKEIARSQLSGLAPIQLAFGTVELRLVQNSGAFLSLGSALPEIARVLIFQVGVPVLLLALCVVNLRDPALSKLQALGLALIAAGGIGNWIDRLLQDGTVTDFVRLGIGPLHTGIFNVADVAVFAGVGLFLLGLHRINDPDPDPEPD